MEGKRVGLGEERRDGAEGRRKRKGTTIATKATATATGGVRGGGEGAIATRTQRGRTPLPSFNPSQLVNCDSLMAYSTRSSSVI